MSRNYAIQMRKRKKVAKKPSTEVLICIPLKPLMSNREVTMFSTFSVFQFNSLFDIQCAPIASMRQS